MRLLPFNAKYFWLLIGLFCGLPGLTSDRASANETEITRYQATQTLWAGDSAADATPGIGNVSRQVYRILVQVDGLMKGGTAFLVSGSRVVATNNHVIDKGTAYMLGYVAENGHVRWVKLQLLAVFPQKDLALLRAVEDLPGQAFQLAVDFPELASDLYAFGFPAAADLGEELGPAQATDRNFFLPSVVKGAVSRIISGPWLTHQLQHQTPISPGYSGGPLVDNRGIVVGVSSAVHKETNGISYGVAAPDLARFLSACALTVRTAHLPRFTRVDTPPAADIAAAPAQRRPQASSGAPNAVIRQAYEMLGRGDIARARTTFEYAAQKNPSREAYEGLAKSYDPTVLQTLRVVGDLADARKAREFYAQAQRADGSGPPAAAAAAVSSASCNNDLCMMREGPGGVPVVVCTTTTTAR